ncbi:MAG: ATP-dependent ligase, partial [Microbacterium sp.]|nr:ATP-dependent ligase [Microbacterium sp.]
DDLDAALTVARQLDLEGAVVKDPSSRYRIGVRSEEWLKVKLTRTRDVVVGAIRPGKGARRGGIGSLLLGIPDGDGALRYAGRVGSGFSDAELTRLTAALDPLRTDRNPFVGVPASDASDALWVRPELVGEVEFAEFTPGGILRHARWRGLRPDRAPGDVRRDDG